MQTGGKVWGQLQNQIDGQLYGEALQDCEGNVAT